MIEKLSEIELEEIYSDKMPLSFPKDEIRPYKWVKNLYDNGNYPAFGEKSDNRIISYALFVTNENRCLLDYLATDSEKRGNGIGGKLLDYCKSAMSKFETIYIEIEAPESAADKEEKAIRNRRMGFYMRHGAKLSEIKTEVFGVKYSIMYLSDNSISSEKVRTDITQLYSSMAPYEIYKKNFLIR